MLRIRWSFASSLDAVSAALAVLAGRAPADPVKIHGVLFTALRAEALHLGLVVIHKEVGVLKRLLGRLAFFRCAADTAFKRWHVSSSVTDRRRSEMV